MQGIKSMRMNMKTSLSPVDHDMKSNPNMRMSALREALSKRRKNRIAKAKILDQNTDDVAFKDLGE